MIITKLDSKKDEDNQYMHLLNLKQLIGGEDNLKKTIALETAVSNIFRVRFSVSGIIPNLNESYNKLSFLRILNTKTG